MRHRSRIIVGIIGFAALGVAVGTAESAPPKTSKPSEAGKDKPKKLQPVRLRGVDVVISEPPAGSKPEFKKLPNGNYHGSERIKVAVPSLGERELVGVVEDEPVAKGGRLKATITDATAQQTATFAFDPGTNTITFGADGKTASVVQNPDHTYRVDGKPAKTGKDVVRLLKTSPAYAKASAHSVLLAYAYAQSPSLEARVPCNTAGNTGSGWDAVPPAVCSTFRDVCDCIACDKAGKGAACELCK